MKVNSSALEHVEGSGYFAEASTLGLPVGKFPHEIESTQGRFVMAYTELDDEGELVSVMYLAPINSPATYDQRRLRVYND